MFLSFLCMNKGKSAGTAKLLCVSLHFHMSMSPKLMTKISDFNKILETHLSFAPAYFENKARERALVRQVCDIKKKKKGKRRR